MSTVAALIAIVDDEESVRKALVRLIRAAGFSVDSYSSGADFLSAVEERPPHCVVLDLRMDIVPMLFGADYWDWELRKAVSVWFGLAMILLAFWVDLRSRFSRDYA